MTHDPNRSAIISYAVWFRLSEPHADKIRNIFDELRRVSAKHRTLTTDLPPPTKFGDSYRIGEDFYLLHIEEHWSAGDICGHIRHFKLIDPDEEVIAVRLDRADHWDLPAHGLLDRKAQTKLYKWKEQASQWYYVRNP